MSTPICTLTLQLFADGTFAYAYTSEPGQEVQLGRFTIPMSQLLATALQNANVRIPTHAEREVEIAEALAKEEEADMAERAQDPAMPEA